MVVQSVVGSSSIHSSIVVSYDSMVRGGILIATALNNRFQASCQEVGLIFSFDLHFSYLSVYRLPYLPYLLV